MGIRGLTTFVAQYSDKFLQPHELHNTYLVLDGNNICCQLYIWHTKAHDCFGGDYDTFGHVIELFFEALAKCNITPIVIFDGNYEWKKFKTICARQKDRIRTAGQLTPATEWRCKVFPLFTRVMFADVVKRMGIYVYRCELEADNEAACLSRALNCPVMSYDSDYYIFDVLYIPFDSVSIVPRYNKYHKTWYLSCNLYKTENFLKSFPGLRREHLPLIATVLGNDYIKASVFSKFYSQLKLQRGKNSTNIQQRRILTVIQWLRTETFESAVCKILNRLKMHQRKVVAENIDIIVKGYICCDSIVLRDLNITYRPKESCTFDLKYNLDELIANCDKVGNLLDTPSDTEEEVSDEDEYLKETEEEQDIQAECTLNIPLEEINDHEGGAISSYKNIPSWFVRKHKLCEYPALIYEVVHELFFLCKPQLEDYSNKSSHSICFNILSAINKILTEAIYDEERVLRVIGRNGHNGMIRFHLPPFGQEVVSLSEIPSMTVNERLTFMLRALDLSFCKDTLTKVPADWQLMILCVIFWVKNCNVQMKPIHTLSVFLCAIILKIVDKKLGPIRNLTRLRSRHSKLLNEPTDIVTSANLNNIEQIFNAISDRESAFTMSALIPNFQMSDKIARNHKQFDIRIIDAFAQFQCCIFYISALNCLLNDPIENLIISDFYNGIFLYNIFTNLNKRNDVVIYLKEFLSNSPNIVNACLKLEALVADKINRAPQMNTNKKRRKFRKNKNAKAPEAREEFKENTIETFVDKNNSYSILSCGD